MDTHGTLSKTEHHPAADDALKFLQSLGIVQLTVWQEAFSSCAIEGNRLAEICAETLNRILSGKPVSDRYLLGLAWTIKQRKNNDTKE